MGLFILFKRVIGLAKIIRVSRLFVQKEIGFTWPKLLGMWSANDYKTLFLITANCIKDQYFSSTTDSSPGYYPTAIDCQNVCQSTPGCLAFSFRKSDGLCYTQRTLIGVYDTSNTAWSIGPPTCSGECRKNLIKLSRWAFFVWGKMPNPAKLAKFHNIFFDLHLWPQNCSLSFEARDFKVWNLDPDKNAKKCSTHNHELRNQGLIELTKMMFDTIRSRQIQSHQMNEISPNYTNTSNYELIKQS